ncbi:MAG: STAS domain-containing protein [Candidatus Sericytochromatia bacterium]
MSSSLPPFAVGQLEDVLVLTVLLSDLGHSNAGWLKEHLLEFVARYRPRQLVINLCNVVELDRLGVGLLISLNTQLKSQLSLSFAGVTPELEERLQALYLRHAFKIADPRWPCLICHQVECGHSAAWERLLEQFRLQPDQAYPTDLPALHSLPGYHGGEGYAIEEVVAAFERDPRYQALEALREHKAFWRQVRHYTAIGLMSSVFVFGALVVILLAFNSRWLAVLEETKTRLQRPEIEANKERVLQPHELIERFDKDGDGLLTREDWPYLSSGEKLTLINHGFHERKLRNRPPFPQLGP